MEISELCQNLKNFFFKFQFCNGIKDFTVIYWLRLFYSMIATIAVLPSLYFSRKFTLKRNWFVLLYREVEQLLDFAPCYRFNVFCTSDHRKGSDRTG